MTRFLIAKEEIRTTGTYDDHRFDTNEFLPLRKLFDRPFSSWQGLEEYIDQYDLACSCTVQAANVEILSNYLMLSRQRYKEMIVDHRIRRKYYLEIEDDAQAIHFKMFWADQLMQAENHWW